MSINLLPFIDKKSMAPLKLDNFNLSLTARQTSDPTSESTMPNVPHTTSSRYISNFDNILPTQLFTASSTKHRTPIRLPTNRPIANLIPSQTNQVQRSSSVEPVFTHPMHVSRKKHKVQTAEPAPRQEIVEPIKRQKSQDIYIEPDVEIKLEDKLNLSPLAQHDDAKGKLREALQDELKELLQEFVPKKTFVKKQIKLSTLETLVSPLKIIPEHQVEESEEIDNSTIQTGRFGPREDNFQLPSLHITERTNTPVMQLFSGKETPQRVNSVEDLEPIFHKSASEKRSLSLEKIRANHGHNSKQMSLNVGFPLPQQRLTSHIEFLEQTKKVLDRKLKSSEVVLSDMKSMAIKTETDIETFKTSLTERSGVTPLMTKILSKSSSTTKNLGAMPLVFSKEPQTNANGKITPIKSSILLKSFNMPSTVKSVKSIHFTEDFHAQKVPNVTTLNTDPNFGDREILLKNDNALSLNFNKEFTFRKPMKPDDVRKGSRSVTDIVRKIREKSNDLKHSEERGSLESRTSRRRVIVSTKSPIIQNEVFNSSNIKSTDEGNENLSDSNFSFSGIDRFAIRSSSEIKLSSKKASIKFNELQNEDISKSNFLESLPTTRKLNFDSKELIKDNSTPSTSRSKGKKLILKNIQASQPYSLERKIEARHKIRVITEAMSYVALVNRIIKKDIKKRKEQLIAKDQEKIMKFASDFVLKNCKKELTDLYKDRSNLVVGEKKTEGYYEHQDLIREIKANGYSLFQHLKAILDALISNTIKKKFPSEFLKFLAVITGEHGLPPEKFLYQFELCRLDFTVYGTYRNLNGDQSQMILILLERYLMEPWKYIPEVKEDPKLKNNLKSVSSVLYYVIIDIFKDKLLKIPKEGRFEIPKPKTQGFVFAYASQLDENEQSELDPNNDVIYGLLSRENLEIFHEARKNECKILEQIVYRWHDQMAEIIQQFYLNERKAWNNKLFPRGVIKQAEN